MRFIEISMIVEYNTQRPHIALKEYGRNIHSMVENLMNVEDRVSRSEQAKELVEVMKQFIQPGLKENADLTHKVWDDLFIISNFKLDVDTTFPKPDPSVLTKRPDKLDYSYTNLFFKHYGKNIELLIQQISDMPEGEEKDNGIIYIGRLMKSFYVQYNKDIVEDIVIKQQLEKISKGKIILDLDRIRNENLFDSAGAKLTDRRINNGGAENRDRRSNDRNNNNNNRNRNSGKPNLNNQKRRRK